jgi:hypothetical protein
MQIQSKSFRSSQCDSARRAWLQSTWLQRFALFGIALMRPAIPNRADGRLITLGCGCSSGVEHNLAKVGVVGSNPIARSKLFNSLGDLALALFNPG